MRVETIAGLAIFAAGAGSMLLEWAATKLIRWQIQEKYQMTEKPKPTAVPIPELLNGVDGAFDPTAESLKRWPEADRINLHRAIALVMRAAGLTRLDVTAVMQLHAADYDLQVYERHQDGHLMFILAHSEGRG